MNINRVNSGLIQQAGAANSRVNLTISDRGVAVENNKTPEKVSSPSSQVTSNEALQNVLTNEETQALIERFGNTLIAAIRRALISITVGATKSPRRQVVREVT